MLEGLVRYFKGRMETNGAAALRVEWTGAEGRELPQQCRSVGVCVFCVAGKVREVPCDIKHCSLLLLLHLLLKPKHFFATLCVPCPVNADERC